MNQVYLFNYLFINIKTELERAVDKKNQGNECFQVGKFDEAVKCYSEAIDLCPKNDTEELPKFYQNRAAAFENLVMFYLSSN